MKKFSSWNRVQYSFATGSWAAESVVFIEELFCQFNMILGSTVAVCKCL